MNEERIAEALAGLFDPEDVERAFSNWAEELKFLIYGETGDNISREVN